MPDIQTIRNQANPAQRLPGKKTLQLAWAKENSHNAHPIADGEQQFAQPGEAGHNWIEEWPGRGRTVGLEMPDGGENQDQDAHSPQPEACPAQTVREAMFGRLILRIYINQRAEHT